VSNGYIKKKGKREIIKKVKNITMFKKGRGIQKTAWGKNKKLKERRCPPISGKEKGLLPRGR